MRISDWSSDMCSSDLGLSTVVRTPPTSAWSRFVVPALEKRGSGDDMLNDAKIRAAKPRDKEYKLTDSHRLYLLVTPNGSKLWKWSYAHDHKQKTMAFGRYPMVSLVDARSKRNDARALLAEGREIGRESNRERGGQYV